MDGLFDMTETAEVFMQRLDEVGSGAERGRVEALVDACGAEELDAWARYGLTYHDAIARTDAAGWTERTDAIGKLAAYRNAVDVAQAKTAASADSGKADNSVWMDSTTLAGALDLIFGRTDAIAPTTLVDLETFVRAVVLYDHVYCLPPRRELGFAALNEHWNDRALVPLPIDREDLNPGSGRIATPLGALLYALNMQATRWMHRPDEGPVQAELWQVMLDKWETVLGWRPDIDKLERGFDSGITSDVNRLIHELLVLPDTFGREAMLAAQASPHGDPLPYWLISESAARALFNWELARTLQLPYLGNVARIPFRHALIARQRAATTYVTTQQLDEVLDAAVRDSVAALPLGASILPLPTFTAALLARVTRPNELLDALAELRHETAALRTRRADLQSLLNSADTTLAVRARLQEAVTAEAKRLSAIDGAGLVASAGSVWVSLAFTSPVPMYLLGILGLLQIATTAKPVADALIPRLRQPYEHVLTDLGSVARGSVEAVPRLQRLSYQPSSGDWDQFANGLLRLGRLRVG